MREKRIKHTGWLTALVRRIACPENITYLVLWGIIFAAPILSLYVRTLNGMDAGFEWDKIFPAWRLFSIYLLLFLVHNFLLLPLLMDEPGSKAKHELRRRQLRYLSVMVVVVASFAVYQCGHRPGMPPDSLLVKEQLSGTQTGGTWRPEYPPPPIIGEHDILSVIMLILMFGANIGIKWYYRSQEDRKRMSDLEKKNLEQQLEYLKYQLNPHFLMNTLNNIHALIDIEPTKAQEAIIQLSKILRYVLYDSNRKRVLLSQDVEFMENYVQLMRMRYSDKLRLSATIPEAITDVYVPPMLFISFLENAFKHGVSYQEESFIKVVGKRYQDEEGCHRLRWTCHNSKHRQQDTASLPRQGGVGLANVRQRLDMIYHDDFTLDVRETENTYEVTMEIPLETKLG